MDEEKNIFDQEPTEDAVEVPAEENVVEEVVEEVAEAVEEVAEDAEEVFEEVVEEIKTSSTGKVAVLSAVITAVVMLILAFVCYKFVLNPYNTNCKYAITIAEAAEEMEMSLDQFKEDNGLPKGMPGSTYYVIAQNYIPFTKLAEQNGMTAEEFMEQLKMYYPITEEDLADVDINKATIGDIDKMINDATKRAAEATPDPMATPEPVSQEEAEAVARAILGDEVVDATDAPEAE